MIFQPAARYPADPRAVFVLALSIFSGITAFLIQAAPDSLEAVLPTWAVDLWGVALVVGSITTLYGMTRQTLNGIIVEQVGSVMVGVAAIFYSILVLQYIGESALISSGIIFAWGVACLARWLQLQLLIRSAHRRQHKRDVLDALYADIETHAKREVSRRNRARRGDGAS